MKVKHVLMIAAVLLAMLVMPVAAAEEKSTILEANEGTEYTITIPEKIIFESGLNLEATNVKIGNGASLVVSVSSTGGWQLSLADSPDDTLKYQMLIGGVATTADNPTVLEIALPADSGSKMLTFEKLEEAKKAGTYTDSLTFNIEVVDGGAANVKEFHVSTTEELLSAIKIDDVTIYLNPGEYNNVVFSASTLGDRVTIIGTDGANVYGIDCGSLNSYTTNLEMDSLTLKEVDFVEKGMYFPGTVNKAPWGFINDLSIIDCTMVGTGSDDETDGNRLIDICTSSPGSNQMNNIMITGCTVANAYQGILIGGLHGSSVIKDNVISNVNHNAIALRSIGVNAAVLVKGNEISSSSTEEIVFRIGSVSSGATITYEENILSNVGTSGKILKVNTADATSSIVFTGNTLDGNVNNPHVPVPITDSDNKPVF